MDEDALGVFALVCPPAAYLNLKNAAGLTVPSLNFTTIARQVPWYD